MSSGIHFNDIWTKKYINFCLRKMFYTPRNEVSRGGGLNLDSPCLSVCLSVCMSVNLLCPPCSIYSSGWIISIFGTNDQWHKRVCRMWWPLILTYIFKVIRPWLRKSCLLCSVYTSGWILLIFKKMITIIRGCVACYFFFPESDNFSFWQIFEIFRPWPWKKNLQFSMEFFHNYP